MQTIHLETNIAAPPERCFLLSLSIDLHMASTAQTRERAVGGVTRGLIGAGETVTWRGRHFGVMLEHETKITEYERPTYFQDAMLRGAFRSFVHDHYFEPAGENDTLMRDILRFSAPFGPLGRLAEVMVLRGYLRRFLIARNEMIRRTAEGPQQVWAKFIHQG